MNWSVKLWTGLYLFFFMHCVRISMVWAFTIFQIILVLNHIGLVVRMVRVVIEGSRVDLGWLFNTTLSTTKYLFDGSSTHDYIGHIKTPDDFQRNFRIRYVSGDFDTTIVRSLSTSFVALRYLVWKSKGWDGEVRGN